MEKRILLFSDIDAYKKAFDLSNYIWNMVITWDNFPKFTIGKQLVEAVDSISVNISEGYGRYGKKDKIHFYHYSNGSLFESIDWINKAKVRGLITKEQHEFISKIQSELPYDLNRLIKYTNTKFKY